MVNQMQVLLITAVTLGFVHTVLGPDHYLPFIVMAKARNWNIAKTSIITFLCGVGHILSSVVLGFIGIGLGTAVFKLENIEASRAELAAWAFLIFGVTYFIWGLHRALRNHPQKRKDSLTPWVLFVIFALGPCEPLIPVLMYPAAKGNVAMAVAVAFVFGITTIATMMTIVAVSSLGLSRVPFGKLSKYSHALAGLTIFLCGGAIKFLGL